MNAPLNNKLFAYKPIILSSLLLASCSIFGAEEFLDHHQETIDTYCLECHNDEDWSGGLALNLTKLEDLASEPEIWETVVTKLRTNFMPPVGQARPSTEESTALAQWLEQSLDENALTSVNPGRPGLYRLNRTEYATVIRDVLGLDVDIASILPPDNSSYGFDNIADLLGISPTLLEGYLAAADRISAIAVGDPEFAPEELNVIMPSTTSQDHHVDGLPIGTRGGVLIEHTFPLDAIYEINTKFVGNSVDAIRGLQFEHQFEVAVDGKRVRFAKIGGPSDYNLMMENSAASKESIEGRTRVRVPIPAGKHKISVTFIEKTAALEMDQYQPFKLINFDPVYLGGIPSLAQVTIRGPFNGQAPIGNTFSREKIFTCMPTSQRREAACAKEILSNISRQAYRRDITNQDMDILMDFFQTGREVKGDFAGGIQMGLRRILMSPDFLFRIEKDPVNIEPGAPFSINDIELASRLSFFLWSSVPDEELLELAIDNKLSRPAILEEQIKRMLADERSQALVDNFAGQWLQLRNLASVKPDLLVFPDFDDDLRRSFATETSMFFESILREDRNVLDLMNADYSYLNERLAKHYGINNVFGDDFQRVSLANTSRRGLLGQGSVLTVTSYAHRTSPVIRGKWILDNLLGAEVPTPPDNVPALAENSADAIDKPSMRERLAKHRENPACSVCHNIMDPLGYALEGFDGVGRWRELDEGGLPIDSSGELAGGFPVNGPIDLREALISRPEQFLETFANKMLTYAIGRGLEYYDKPTVRQIISNTKDNDYRFSAIVQEIVQSVPFKMKRAAIEEELEIAAEENSLESSINTTEIAKR